MAKWSDRLNQMTQNAISKSREVAGIAKLNVDNTSLHLDIKNIQTKIGAYVVKNKLLQEDASVAEWTAEVEAVMAKVEENNDKIRAFKNVEVCPECGAQIPGAGRYCEKCGAEFTVPASVVEVAAGAGGSFGAKTASDGSETAEAAGKSADADASERSEPKEGSAGAEV